MLEFTKKKSYLGMLYLPVLEILPVIYGQPVVVNLPVANYLPNYLANDLHLIEEDGMPIFDVLSLADDLPASDNLPVVDDDGGEVGGDESVDAPAAPGQEHARRHDARPQGA